MQQPVNAINPEYILETIIRRRWFIIAPFCVVMLVGIYLSLTLPKVYEASTLILVQSQRVPTNYVQSVVTTDIVSRLQTISQQIMSRTNIERIISDYKLFSEPQYAGMFMEDKVESVRKRIAVNVSKSSTFTLSFNGPDPEKVTSIANALATYFIDENLKVREAQAVGTSDFLDDELESIRVKLEKSEQILREYRQKYMGELPDQLQSNLSILQRLSEELIEKQKALRETRAALGAMENQMAGPANVVPLDAPDRALQPGGAAESMSLPALEEKLVALKSRYKEGHPDVQRIQTMIDKLRADEKTSDVSSSTEKKETSYKKADQRALQTSQLGAARNQVRELEMDIADLTGKIALYQKRVEETPKREEELLTIRRDYDNLKGSYDSLLKRRMEAEISVNMEKKQKGEQFQVIDPAKLPEKPISPNMQRLLLMMVAAGLGIGGGIVFLLEYLNAAYRSPEEMEKSLGLPILATVPVIPDPKLAARQRLNYRATLASIAVSVFLLGVFLVMTLKGPDKIIAFIKNLI